MLRSVFVAVTAAGLLAVGALSALAGNSHGKAVSTLATGTTLKGDAISTLARATGELKSDAARANADAAPAATQAQAETDSDAADEATDEATDEDANEDTDEDADEAAPSAPAAAPAVKTEQEGAEHDD
jgi:hypothetical protein